MAHLVLTTVKASSGVQDNGADVSAFSAPGTREHACSKANEAL